MRSSSKTLIAGPIQRYKRRGALRVELLLETGYVYISLAKVRGGLEKALRRELRDILAIVDVSTYGRSVQICISLCASGTCVC